MVLIAALFLALLVLATTFAALAPVYQRIGDAVHPVRAGDVIACPPGGPRRSRP